MPKSNTPENEIKSNNFLNQVISVQAALAQANFDINKFMQLIADQMQILTPATGVVVELAEGEDMVYRAATGTVASHIGLHLKQSESISGLCVSINQVLRSDDTEHDPRVNLEACRRVKARSLVVAPLVYDGHVVGVLKILSDKPKGFSEKDVQTLQMMASFIASGLAHQMFYDSNEKMLKERTKELNELEEAQEHLHHKANYDALTDLPNRSLFNDRLIASISKAKRSKSQIALMYLDIDHFKSINDELGHDIGDELLKAFGARIKQCIRNSDLAARLGGDEFVVLLDEISTHEDAINIAKKIVSKAKEKFKFKNTTINVTTSIGLTFYDGKNIKPAELLKQADKALYLAKKAGRNTFKIYES